MAKRAQWSTLWAKGMASGVKALRQGQKQWGRQVAQSLKAAKVVKAIGPAKLGKAAKPGKLPKRVVRLGPSRAVEQVVSPPSVAGAHAVVAGPLRSVAVSGDVLRRRVQWAGHSLSYAVYRPAGLAPPQGWPVMLMLHGCGQDADTFAAVTRMNRLADRERCLVVYPQQSRVANAQRCWNWFDTRGGRAQQEVALVLKALDQVCRADGPDPSRVVVVGLSAGAGLAALAAVLHPERFAAVVMHSGVPPGQADSGLAAWRAMRGGTAWRRQPASPGARAAVGPGPVEAAAVAGAGLPELQALAGTAWPPLLVIHGQLDGVVAVRNAHQAVALWARHAGATAALPRQVQRGQRYAMALTDHRAGGRLVARLAVVAQLGHAWSGGAAKHRFSEPAGPDASRMAWAFGAAQFKR